MASDLSKKRKKLRVKRFMMKGASLVLRRPKPPKARSLMTNGSQADVDNGGAAPKQPSEDLQKYWRGEITQDEYLQTRLALAMAHVRGRVSNDNFEMIREVITDMLEEDPILVAMKERLLRKQ
jgi:hypothetical protein